jgi:dienelactone hydrolase
MVATSRRFRRLLRWSAWALLGVVVVVAGLVATAAIARQRPRTLPGPTGQYAVGRTMREWTDPGRMDPLAPQPDQHRSLAVWLWYPAVAMSGPTAAYAPGLWSSVQQQGFLAGPLDTIRTSEYDDVPAADGRFPLVVLEPGLGLSAPQFTTLAQELASHGYVVAGVTPTYSANATVLHGRVVERSPKGNPENLTAEVAGGLVEVWAVDARFAARQVASLESTDRLGGHVDAARIAYIGHSLGGAASLQACHDDVACVGAVDLDGTPYGPVAATGLNQPFLLLSSQDGCLAGQCRSGADGAGQEVQAAARKLIEASTGRNWRYAVDGAQHFNFTDYAAYFLVPPLHHLFGQLGSINGRRGLEITNACVLAFLDHVLGSGPAPDNLDTRFSELRAYR